MSVLNFLVIILIVAICFACRRRAEIKRLRADRFARERFVETAINEALIAIRQQRSLGFDEGVNNDHFQRVRERFRLLLDDKYVDRRINELLLAEAREAEQRQIEESSSSEFDESVFDDEETVAERENKDTRFRDARKPISTILDEIYK